MAHQWPTILAAGLIVLSVLAAYHNSFVGAYAYDDEKAILENPTIRQLWPIWPVLSPPCNGETVGGRPLLNLSLAINYAMSGFNVWSYHATNVAIHCAAALLLLGILRRTLLTPVLRDRFGGAATPLALAGALLWALHPLQTESVTYIVQRAESMTGLFYLLTLYCVIRGAGTVPFFAADRPVPLKNVPGEKGDCPPSRSRLLWYAAAVLACLLGMACKEVMVTAPLIVLLYDRTFLAGSFREAWRRRWGLYLGLAATWGLLGYLVLSTGLIFRQEEMGAPDTWSYALTQPGVILYYLRLSVWPSPLCMGYEWPVATTPGEILPGVIVVGVLLAATAWGLMGRKIYGFLGAWFFLILTPTSSILPLNQLAFEHRMYLSLAAVVVLVVAGGYVFWDRLLPRPAMCKGDAKKSPLSQVPTNRRAAAVRWAVPVVVLTAVLVALGCATVTQNSVYRSLLSIWQDVLDKRPQNPFAHYNLATVLDGLGRTDEAIAQYREALELQPNYIKAHINLGALLAVSGQAPEAIEHYLEVLRLKPDHAEAHNNLGLVFVRLGRVDDALEHYHKALQLKPGYPQAHNNLANALAKLGRTDEAIQQYREALRFRPDFAEAHSNLGLALASTAKTKEAMEHYQEALRLKPDYPEAHYNLGNMLVGSGRTDEAIEHYQEALRVKPAFTMARYSLANVLVHAGRTREAIQQYDQLLQLMPDSAGVLDELARLLATREPAQGGDPARAVRLAQRARELAGQENARYFDTLAAAYAAAGRFSDAVITAQRAIQLAESTGQASLAKALRARLDLYSAGQPYREAPPSPAQTDP